MRQILIGVFALVLALRASADTLPVNTAPAVAGDAVTTARAQEEDRLGVLVGSALSAVFAYAILRLSLPRQSAQGLESGN